MCTRVIPESRRAFTLLEVMIATVIIAMVAIGCLRFLTTNLNAIRSSSALDSDREALQSVVRLIQFQLNNLPPREEGALSGQPFRFHGLSNDEITWYSGPGPGLLTTAAPGEYRVTLTVQPVSERSRETELGLRRHPIEVKNAAGPRRSHRGAVSRKYSWAPLIRPMAAFEVRYFDNQSDQWVNSWTNDGRRPRLVRVRLWRHAGDAPIEAVLPVPSAQIQS